MSAKKGRKLKHNHNNVNKTRKERRKEERKNKKARRNEYYTSRRQPGHAIATDKNEPGHVIARDKNESTGAPNKRPLDVGQKTERVEKIGAEEARMKEKKQQMKLQKQMNKQRKKQLLDANFDEDRNIKRLEKQLKLNKRKSKAVPASFARDGLDFLLEVCEPNNMKNSALAEENLANLNDDFEEDIALMTEDIKTGKKNKKDNESEDDFSFSDMGESENEMYLSENENEESIEEDKKNHLLRKSVIKGGKPSTESDDSVDEDMDDLNDDSDDQEENSTEEEGIEDDERNSNHREEKEIRKSLVVKRTSKIDRNDNKKQRKSLDPNNDSDEVNDDDDGFSSSESIEGGAAEEKQDGTWQDIYGRLRDKNGSIIMEKSEKYTPPGARIKNDISSDKEHSQKLEKLKKQLKGLINRLAESNMHSIATQIEDLYMTNSRNNMNTTITNLITSALISHVLAPERLLMEHVLLIVILHANVGTEVGAHFLQTIIKQFDDNIKNPTSAEDKNLDNLVVIISQLYNFKLFDSKLVYEVIEKLSSDFNEKHVECILHILKNVGFNLRKDSPIALKNLILSLQKKAASASDELKDNPRVKFMLDILLAIKNNNVTKIPNYDTSYSEHLKKIMKGFIRKGNYVTQLNISLEDLLKADEKGKWWVIGSAWMGNTIESSNTTKTTTNASSAFSEKLLELASKQRMNTDTRRSIFCIIMSAEDYLDAFEKLLRLGLKNQQEREIIHVILHCCLQEKIYNPYYATLAQKFCESDRKYQMTIKYSIWDKLKALKDHSATQISHLAKLLGHLFLEKGLPISTLKIVQFSELDKVSLRFIRQILLGILLHDDLEECKAVFEKVSHSDKLKMFKESLRLFLHHFLLKNLDSQGIAEDKKELLQQRVKVVERLLTAKDTRSMY